MESEHHETIHRNARKTGHTFGYYNPNYEYQNIDTGDSNHDMHYNLGFRNGFDEGRLKRQREKEAS